MGGVQKEMVEGQKGHKEIWIIDIEDRQNRLGVYLNNKPKNSVKATIETHSALETSAECLLIKILNIYVV